MGEPPAGVRRRGQHRGGAADLGPSAELAGGATAGVRRDRCTARSVGLVGLVGLVRSVGPGGRRYLHADGSRIAGPGRLRPVDFGPVDFGPVDFGPVDYGLLPEFDESEPDARRWYRMLSDQSPARPEPAPVVSDRDHPATAVSATPTPDFAAAMVEPTETYDPGTSTDPGRPGFPGLSSFPDGYAAMAQGSGVTAVESVQTADSLPKVTSGEMADVRRLLDDPRFDRGTRRVVKRTLRVWSEKSGPGSLVAWPQWRSSPELAGRFPSVIALSVLRWPTRKRPDDEGWPIFRQELGHAVLGALWRHVEATMSAERGVDVGPVTAAELAQSVAAAVTGQAPSTGGNPDLYHGNGMLPTSRLALAFIDHTLRAVETEATDQVDQVDQPTWSTRSTATTTFDNMTSLRSSNNASRSSRTVWADEVGRFVADVEARVGGQAWFHLQNRLRLQSLGPDGVGISRSRSPGRGHRVRRSPRRRWLTHGGFSTTGECPTRCVTRRGSRSPGTGGEGLVLPVRPPRRGWWCGRGGGAVRNWRGGFPR